MTTVELVLLAGLIVFVWFVDFVKDFRLQNSQHRVMRNFDDERTLRRNERARVQRANRILKSVRRRSVAEAAADAESVKWSALPSPDVPKTAVAEAHAMQKKYANARERRISRRISRIKF